MLHGLNSITGGTLDFDNDNQLGDVANDITISNRATLLAARQWDPAATRVITIGTVARRSATRRRSMEYGSTMPASSRGAAC